MSFNIQISNQFSSFLEELDAQELWPDNVREVLKNLNDKYKVNIELDIEMSKKYFKLELENIHIVKSVSNGFFLKEFTIKKNEKGEDVEYIWPDFNSYDQTSFDYLYYRFKNSTNKLLKCNYGLTVYIGGKVNDNREKKELVLNLYEVVQSILKEDRGMKFFYKNSNVVSEFLRNAFHISVKSKLESEIEVIIKFVSTQLNSLLPSDNYYYTFFNLMTDLYSDNKKIIDRYLNVKELITKIESDLQILSKEDNLSSALFLARKGLNIVQKHKDIRNEPWQKRIGELFERMGNKEVGRGNKFGSSNYQEAGKYYKLAKESILEKEVISKYESVRGSLELGLITSRLSDRVIENIDNFIDELVEERNPSLILCLWTLKSFITPVNDIWTKVENNPPGFFLDFLSKNSINKFGDISEKYETEIEIKSFQFWQQFAFSFQLSSKIVYSVTLKAIKNKVILVEHIIEFFKESWLNKPITRMYNGSEVSIVPNDTIIPPLTSFFYCFSKFIENENEVLNQDFVTSIDSMILKVETILRFAMEEAELNSTIISKSSNGYSVAKYKLLGSMFQELDENGYFDEMDVVLFKYLFLIPEKVNYRNDIAHGVFDLNQYNPRNGLVILGALVRLAMIDFKKKEINVVLLMITFFIYTNLVST